MIDTKKVEDIKNLRLEGLTLKEIGKIKKLSSERVRQILTPIKLKICKIHQVVFSKECSYCFYVKTYSEFLKHLFDYQIPSEASRLSIQDKNKVLVIQRVLFIRKMRDEKKMPFTKIAKLLNRDHSSVINLYRKKIL